MTCQACEKIKEKKNIAYEDNEIVIFLDPAPCAVGHVKIFTKKHAESLQEITKEESNKLFKTASAVSSVVFESIKAQGTNIICNEGIEEHLCVHVIPRMSEDGLDFKWNAKQMEQEDLDKIFEKIKDKAFFIGKDKKQKSGGADGTGSVIDEDKKAEEIEKFVEEEEKEEDYMLKHIKRIP